MTTTTAATAAAATTTRTAAAAARPATAVEITIKRQRKSRRIQRRQQATKRRKALDWHSRRCQRLLDQADKYVSHFGERLRMQYGFLADPSKPLWFNIIEHAKDLPSNFLSQRPRNLACHNYLTTLPTPAGALPLLGLGLNFCISTHKIKTTIHTFDSLREDVRRKYHLQDSLENDGSYIPSLYIKSDYKFDPASEEIEAALSNFEQSWRAEQAISERKTKIVPNLTPRQWSIVTLLQKHDQYIVIPSDKGLGP